MKSRTKSITILILLLHLYCEDFNRTNPYDPRSSNYFRVITTTLKDGNLNSIYSDTINVSGGTHPFEFTVDSGKLPVGLILDNKGIIGGTPSKAGIDTFSIRIKDESKPVIDTSIIYNIKILDPLKYLIAFSSRVNHNYEIIIMNSDGSNHLPIPITQNKENKFNPDWSPDDSKIVFHSLTTKGSIGIIKSDNSEDSVKIIDIPFSATDPDWSVEIDKIAFVLEKNGITDIYTVNPDGTKLKNITNTPDRNENAPTWSPDGTKILYLGDKDLYIKNSDGTGSPVSLNLNSHFQGQLNGSFSEKYRNRRNDLSKAITGSSLLGDPINIFEGFPCWSPDGEKIAFTLKEDEDHDIYIINVNSRISKNLTNNDKTDDGYPSWAPNGIQIVYTSKINGKCDICRMDTNGDNWKNLTEDFNYDDDAFPACSNRFLAKFLKISIKD